MLSVTADTNIYVSALNFGGNPLRLLNLAEAGSIRLAVSDAILAEIGETLRGRKFKWPDEKIEKAQRQIARYAQRVTTTEAVDVIKDDPPDNRILECAAAAKSEYIVSGDDDLLRLRRYGNARILKVAEFLDTARGESRGPGHQH